MNDGYKFLSRVRRFKKKDLKLAWENARMKRFDTGVYRYNDFEDWYKLFTKLTK